MQGKKGVSRVSHRKDLRVLLRSLSVVVVGVRNDTLSQFHAMLLSCIVHCVVRECLLPLLGSGT